MAKPTLKVEGTQQVLQAFSEVSKGIQDLSAAHRTEADMLLPEVARLSRWESGDLAQGWEPGSRADAAEFTNRVAYAGVQEYGWSERGIEPTQAVAQAFANNESRTEQIYNDAIASIAEAANIATRKG